MEINYNLTEKDYIHFNLYHIKNSKSSIRALALQRFIVPVFFLVMPFIYTSISGTPFLPRFIIFLIISMIWVLYYPKYFYNLIARNVKKMIREGKNEGLLGDHHLKLSEEGIVDTSSQRETKVTWSGITSFKEDDGYFYLYNSSVSAYILPKREIDHEDEVRDYIHARFNH